MSEIAGAKAAKREVRAKARAMRNAVLPDARKEKSIAICRRIERRAWLGGARAVMVYAAVRGEVDLTSLIKGLLSKDCIVAFPVIDAERKSIAPVAVASLRELVPGAFGIPAPPPGGLRLDPEELDAVIIPGLVFDREGYRVGYGGGYYDRFLPTIREDALRIGVVYHDLLWPKLPREPFDERVDWVVTESTAAGPFRTPEPSAGISP